MNVVTRLDFDGVLCAVMLHEMETIAEVGFSTPQALEEGQLMDGLKPGDIVAHLPFHRDAGYWYHNHDTSHLDQAMLANVKGKWGVAPSSSRQIFDHYKSAKLDKYKPLVELADKIGTANMTKEDVLTPSAWVKVAYTLDPRFAMDYNYGMTMMNAIKAGKSPDEILALPQVARRWQLYQADEERYQEELKAHTKVFGNVILTDFRTLDRAPRGNRFFAFIQYPEGNVHVRLESGAGRRVKVSVSKSIFNKTCQVDVGKLMEEYGGGGPAGAGTCIIGALTADEKVMEIIKKLK